MGLPQLYVFAISHYCEKARWALDYPAVDYELMYLAPGMHANLLADLGVAGSSLPVLVIDEALDTRLVRNYCLGRNSVQQRSHLGLSTLTWRHRHRQS